ARLRLRPRRAVLATAGGGRPRVRGVRVRPCPPRYWRRAARGGRGRLGRALARRHRRRWPAAAEPPGGAGRLGGRARAGGERDRHRGRARRGRSEHLRGVPDRPGRRWHRVRRAQADVRAQVTGLTGAGAGMAGLVCAARARQLGAAPVVYEKGTRAGGSMLLSSCVVWRYRTLEDFRHECAGGDETLQRLIVDRLDDALGWLESLGAPVVRGETGNPGTVGTRFDPAGLTDALVRAAGDVRLGETIDRPLVLATGGFAGDHELVTRYITPQPLALRANPWSSGDGLRAGLAAGGALTAGMHEFYGRNMPDAPFGEADFVPLAQLYADRATVVDDAGRPFLEHAPTRSETDVVQATARQPGARAWSLRDDETLAAA